MNVKIDDAKEIIGATMLTDGEIEKHTTTFFKWVTEMTESYKDQYVAYIKARESALRYDAKMYGDDGSYKGRDTNDEGEPSV